MNDIMELFKVSTRLKQLKNMEKNKLNYGEEATIFLLLH
jgi:hypothetical protein